MDSAKQQLSLSEERALLRCKDEKLKAEVKQKEEILERLKKKGEEMIQRRHEAQEDALSYEKFLQCKAVDQKVKETEEQWQIVAQKKEQLRRLQEEILELKERRDPKLKMVEKMSPYHDFLEEVVKTTKFENVQALVNHLENLLYIRDKLSQTESIKLEEIDKKRTELLNLEDKHHVALVHKHYQLIQLQTELEKYRSETHIWNQKWEKIHRTAAKRTLKLGQIKMATLNLYEMTGGAVAEDGVDIKDIDTQLEKILSFVQDHDDIVKQFQFSLQKEKDKKDKAKSKHKGPDKYLTHEKQ